jgi:hypothetical protein
MIMELKNHPSKGEYYSYQDYRVQVPSTGRLSTLGPEI